MIVCVLLPRFALAVAAGGRDVLAAGPVALAPEPGREQFIGEVSAAAEAYGLRAGLRLGEALARCPTLRLVAPDPAGVADAWDAHVRALEGIGAAVEPGPPGTAWFGAGGSEDAARRHARRRPRPPRARALERRPVRLGAAPSRFAALAAAGRARARRAEVTPLAAAALAAYLAPLPVSLLLSRPEVAMLPDALERFGIAHARRAGQAAARRARRPLRARRPAGARPRAGQGHARSSRARRPSGWRSAWSCRSRPPASQLQRGLELLIDRLLARRERRGRALRAVVLSAKLVEGGTWRARVTFREPLADPRRMRLVLGQKLSELPSPTDVLRLRAEGFGPPAGDQRSLLAEPAAIRRARLREAVRQARSVAGPDAALRIIPVDPDSRVPERRLTLAPWDP